MSQKSSLPQPAESVPRVLTADNPQAGNLGHRSVGHHPLSPRIGQPQLEQVEQQLGLKSIREQYAFGTAVRTCNKQFKRLAPARPIDVAAITAPRPPVAGTRVAQPPLHPKKSMSEDF
jgi:hypothetical protein